MDLYNNYQKLYKLSQEQKKAIENSDYDQLLKILNQKQNLIKEIEKINLEEYLNEQENHQDSLDQLKSLMQKMKELEDENEKKLRGKKELLGDKMKDINLKQRGRKGYQTANKFDAKFIDKKS